MNRTPSIDARCISLDETKYYNFNPEHAPFIEKMYGIYLYDKNSYTHCCEFTPSYFLIHLYDSCVLNEAGQALSEEKKDEIYQAYEHTGENEDKYVHCSSIDSLEKELVKKSFRYHRYGRTGVRLRTVPREQQMESLQEHFRANCPL